ncbi:MAG: hypothetical protein IJA94_06600 [Bacilli bacterium]|nr:hypothetical protein [Bacilli bacterium]MBQ3415303.1 hypothetical protein [Clostridia bacterium]MBQ6632432.1 hypothetical protein [Romboutsia sp.]MBR0058207.1 hypothetical protein [Methanobrevibacter sp.]MBQ4584540.1 hypothetical protein [Bacilli bacterium]
MTRYKLPLHIKNYVKTELYDYRKNKRIINELENDNNIRTRTILLTLQKINKIDKILNSLSDEDKEAVEKIFFEKHNQVFAEMNDNLTKDMYYNIMNKMIYLTAIEFELI